MTSIKISGNVELLSRACFPLELTAKFASVGRAFSECSLTEENLSSVGITPLEIKVSAFSRTVEMLNKAAKQNVLVLGLGFVFGLDSELSMVKRYKIAGSVEAINTRVLAREESEHKSSANSWLVESIAVNLAFFGSFDKIPSSTISVLCTKLPLASSINALTAN